MGPLSEDDPLDDFEARLITLAGVTKVVHTAGDGPAVIVMAEMPGISPEVARFSRWVRDAGFSVYMPSLFGRDGAVPGAEEGTAVLKKACVSAEFRAFASGGSSPVTHWLRALARMGHDECGGPGVGAIGMCFTGNFALTMMLEPSVLAPILCQPSLPLDDPAGLEISAVNSAWCGAAWSGTNSPSGPTGSTVTGSVPRSASPPTPRPSGTASSPRCCPTVPPTPSLPRSSNRSSALPTAW